MSFNRSYDQERAERKSIEDSFEKLMNVLNEIEGENKVINQINAMKVSDALFGEEDDF